MEDQLPPLGLPEGPKNEAVPPPMAPMPVAPPVQPPAPVVAPTPKVEPPVPVAPVSNPAVINAPSNSQELALPSKGIAVVALEPGTYFNSRRDTDEEFTVLSGDRKEGEHYLHNVGTWMRCIDPKLEEIHQELMVARKAALKAKKAALDPRVENDMLKAELAKIKEELAKANQAGS